MSDWENRLLTKLLESPENIARAQGLGLRPDVFKKNMHQSAYAWICKCWTDSGMTSAPTRLTLENQCGGIKLLDDVPEDITLLVGLVQRSWASTQIQLIQAEAAKTTLTDPIGSARQLWQNAYDLVEKVTPRYGREDLSQTGDARWQQYLASAVLGMGVTMGLPELDDVTRGLRPGELACVAGYTKTGKTFYLAKAALEARRAGLKPMLFTLEMDIAAVGQRIDAMHSGLSYEHLQNSDLSPEQNRTYRATLDEIREMGQFLLETPPRGERTVKQIVNRARQEEADYLIIDQLSYLDTEGDYRWSDRATTAKHADLIFDLKTEISNQFAGMVPCMLAVQLNRETVRANSSGRGELHNFAHTSAIEQTCDFALGLWRTREMRNNNVMVIDIIGSRRTQLASWVLNWQLSGRTDISVLRRYEENESEAR